MSSECTHHWLLETPNGPLVNGTCKLCGATQNFPSSGESEYSKKFNSSRKRAQKVAASNRKKKK